MNHPPSPYPKPARKRPAISAWGFSFKLEGFSLVEVVVALGIVSFAVIAILGLIPSGLNTLKDSTGETVRAQIVRSIAASALTANFSSLNASVSFDNAGQPLLPTDTATYPRYTVNATTDAPSFPGSTSGNFTGSLTALKIEIILKPASLAKGTTNNYTLQIANSGK
jgi:uncharacterized protein (TIGR02598 family)